MTDQNDLKLLLESVDLGSRTAEDEAKQLRNYFVETAQWKRIISGAKDVVYGAKGAGKSAMFAILVNRSEEFSKRGIVIKRAEESLGDPLFVEVAVDPPTTEREWRLLWRAYFLSLIRETLDDNAITTESARQVSDGLERAGLLKVGGLRGMLQGARAFARRMVAPNRLELESTVNDARAVSFKAAVELGDAERGVIEAASLVSGLFEPADRALDEAGLSVWIIIDRLDVAFNDQLVEGPAIRALMRVYLDLAKFEAISLKIFLRTDIWKAISRGGFREGSHVVRSETISWNRDTLLNLAMRRILDNPDLASYLQADPPEILGDLRRQEQLFEFLFDGISDGDCKPTMLDTLIGSIREGHGHSAPREMIHLLSELRDRQIERLQVGRPGPQGGGIFEVDLVEDAIAEVSRVHLEQTLFNEYPKVETYVEKLRGGTVNYKLSDLRDRWGEDVDSVSGLIGTLISTGFFSPIDGRAGLEVAMLYRPALGLLPDADPKPVD